MPETPIQFTYYGHSCFRIEVKGKHLLFDPFISGNPLASSVDIDAIPADYILLSHGHGDHVLDAERIAKRTGALILSSYEVVSWYELKGLKGHPLNLGGKVDLDFGTVKFVNAVHSSVLPDGTYGGNPGGFVVYAPDEFCFYYAGDTALTMDMQLIPLTCPEIDFAILPIGDNFTMGAADAAIAADWIGVERVIGCHYDTFGYIKIDHQFAQSVFEERGIELTLPAIGQNLALN